MKNLQQSYFFYSVCLILIICFSSDVILANGTLPNNDSYEIVNIGSLEDSLGNTIKVIDNIAFVMSFTGGFSTYDVSNPTNPKKLDTYVSGLGAHTFDIKNDLAIIAFYNSGLKILNVSDPSNIILLDQSKTGSEYYYSAVDGDLAHSIKHKQGFEIVNFSDPTNLVVEGSYHNGNYYEFNYAYQDLAFVQDSTQGKLLILNVSDFSNIFQITNLTLKVKQMHIMDNLAYFALDSGGLKIYNISDITNPYLLSEFNPGGRFRSLEISQDLAFLTHSSGLKIINISDPLSPFEVNKYSNNKLGSGLSVSKNLVYVIYDDRNVEIYQWREGTDEETSTDNIFIDNKIPSYSAYWILGCSCLFLIVHIPWKRRLTM